MLRNKPDVIYFIQSLHRDLTANMRHQLSRLLLMNSQLTLSCNGTLQFKVLWCCSCEFLNASNDAQCSCVNSESSISNIANAYHTLLRQLQSVLNALAHTIHSLRH